MRGAQVRDVLPPGLIILPPDCVPVDHPADEQLARRSDQGLQQLLGQLRWLIQHVTVASNQNLIRLCGIINVARVAQVRIYIAVLLLSSPLVSSLLAGPTFALDGRHFLSATGKTA